MDFSRLSSFLDEFLAAGVPGFDCMVCRDGEVIYRYMNGFSDREAKTPMNGKERYNLYSCSKPITCTAAMQLFERGAFKLEDDLCDYMPEFTEMKVRTPEGLVPAKRKITILDLFTMSAGFDYNTQSPSLLRCYDETHGACPTRTAMKYLAQEPLAFQPGDHWQYSLCHDVLAAFVEVVSGMPFEEYVQKNIFRPLGMTKTTFLLPAAEYPTVAAQYTGSGDQPGIFRIGPAIHNYRIGADYASGGAGCVSTVEDYMKFLNALIRDGALLAGTTLDKMTTRHLSTAQLETYWGKDDNDYGLGLRCPKKGGVRIDSGWGGAAGAYLGFDRKNRITFFYAQHVLVAPTRERRPMISDLVREIVLG